MLLSGHQTFTTLTLEASPWLRCSSLNGRRGSDELAKRANETITREKNYWLCNQFVCESVILSCSFHEALHQTRQRREHFAIGRKAQRPHDKQFFFVCLSSWEYKALKTNHKRASKEIWAWQDIFDKLITSCCFDSECGVMSRIETFS